MKSVAAGVFGDLPNLQEVVIPDSVIHIDSDTFRTIPDDVIVKSKCDNEAVINYVNATGMKHEYVHSNISVIPKVESTCTSYGVKAYYKCSRGKYYTDSSRTNEIADITAWKSGAGRIAKKDHTLKTTTTKATLETNGKKETKCSVCGKVTINPPKTSVTTKK